MKTLYINSNANILIDEEEHNVSRLDTQREAISRVYLIPEAMHIVFGEGETHQELDVKKDDIVIVFYNGAFDKQIVVVKSKDWARNLKIYNEEQQRIKEEWALKKASECGCDGCNSCADTPESK
jgi:hypothetical protein